MTDQQFIENKMTGYFLEFKPLHENNKRAKIELRKTTRRLNTFTKKYQYLTDIVKIGANDNFLADKIKLLLKSAGFTKVIHYKDKRQKIKREDLQAHHEKDVFIIEVKGVNAQTPKKADLIQVASYFLENEKRQHTKKVYGLSIISHQKDIPIENRAKRFENDEVNNDLINFRVGAIPAIGLLVYFSRLKSGKIDFEGFKTALKQTGFIKY